MDAGGVASLGRFCGARGCILLTSQPGVSSGSGGEMEGLSRKRGSLPKGRNLLAGRVRALERENARLKRRAERAEGLVELQKKVSEILGIELKHNAEKD